MFKRILFFFTIGTLPIFAEPQFDFMGLIVFYSMVFITKSMDYLAIPILLNYGIYCNKKNSESKTK